MLPASQPLGIDQCNCSAIRKASRQITRFYDAMLEPSGLRITQYLTLAALSELESAAINALAERLDIERTAMGKMTGLLERDGLISITPSPLDARSRVVQLTKEGRELFQKTLPLWEEAQRQFTQLNGVKTVNSLRRDLAVMVVGDVG
ncbi:MarR family winged helix-turn-helix transcriptional regulator [Pseudomonas sp. NPDC090203]|uniref:MarR family winged helix-turn-helix transcriptional regulator n=1 Tax=Pseudomonas sp. NPDC090203 TaxID=3364477 RepID=UPI003802F2B5